MLHQMIFHRSHIIINTQEKENIFMNIAVCLNNLISPLKKLKVPILVIFEFEIYI